MTDSFSQNITVDHFPYPSYCKGLNRASDIIGDYVIGFISIIGICMKCACLTVLRHKRMKHSFYNQLWSKSFNDLLTCLCGIGYMNSLAFGREFTQVNTFWKLFYQWFIIGIPLRIVFMASSFSEISMILNRYYTILVNQIY